MKRMHVGLKVDDIEQAVEFYNRLFGREPSLQRPDYAKWMLDDPYVNFSIDLHGDGPAGTAHFGIQAPDHEGLDGLRRHVDDVDLPRSDQNDLICGYQLQHKSWVVGPSGEQWEMFFTEGLAAGDSYGCDELPD